MKLFYLTICLLISNFALAENFTIPQTLDLETSRFKTVLDGRIVSEKEKIWSQSVLLVVQSQGKDISQCSGTIIAKDAILTAGHCVKSNADRVKIIFGYSSRNKQNFKIIMSDLILPFKKQNSNSSAPSGTEKENDAFLDYDKHRHSDFEGYFNSLQNMSIRYHYDNGFDKSDRTDIALIFFKGGLPQGFSPAEFYNDTLPKFKESIYSYGYGTDTRDLNKSEIILRESIGKIFANYSNDTDEPLLFLAYSGSDSGNICFGDSGGGTYFISQTDQKMKLIAVMITTFNNCANSGGHLLVYPFISWIEKSIKEYRSKIEL